MSSIMRGDLFWVNFNPSTGTEINKVRPALVISNNMANKYSSRVIVAPITSTLKQIYDFEVQINDASVQGKFLLDQVKSFDKKRLKNKIGSLDHATMQMVNQALKIALDLD